MARLLRLSRALPRLLVVLREASSRSDSAAASTPRLSADRHNCRDSARAPARSTAPPSLGAGPLRALVIRREDTRMRTFLAVTMALGVIAATVHAEADDAALVSAMQRMLEPPAPNVRRLTMR